MTERSGRVVLGNSTGALRLERAAGYAGPATAPEAVPPGGSATVEVPYGDGSVTYDVLGDAGGAGTVEVRWMTTPRGRVAAGAGRDVAAGAGAAFVVVPVAFRDGDREVTDPVALVRAFALSGSVPAAGDGPPPADPTWVFEVRDVPVPASDESGEGVPLAMVPDVVGSGPVQAAAFLAASGFQMHQGPTVVSSPESTWTVLSQDPAGNTFAEPGTVVAVEVGGGPPDPDPDEGDRHLGMPVILKPDA